jgi:hypothetical protein
MKTKNLLFIVLALVSVKLSAQTQQSAPVQSPPPLGSFETNYNYSPFSIKGKDMNIQQVSGALTLPVYSKMQDGKLDFFLAGVGYSGLFFSGIGSEFGGSNFHSFSVPLTFQKAFSPKYALVASFIPTLSSDMKDVSSEDMLYSGAVMLRVRSSDKFTYSVGVVYSRQFFGSIILPIFGMNWNITDKLSISGTLPVSEKINYRLSAKSAIGISNDFGIGGGSYRLSKKTGSDYLQVQQFKSSLYYQYMLSKGLSITASAGYNVVQKLDLYSKDQKVNWVPFNDQNKRGAPLAELSKTGIAIQTGINYRF